MAKLAAQKEKILNQAFAKDPGDAVKFNEWINENSVYMDDVVKVETVTVTDIKQEEEKIPPPPPPPPAKKDNKPRAVLGKDVKQKKND